LNNYLSHHFLGAVFFDLLSTGLVVVAVTTGLVVVAGLVAFVVGLTATGAGFVVSTTLVAASFFSAFCLSCYFFCFLLFSKYS
jgi:hypothetical protein